MSEPKRWTFKAVSFDGHVVLSMTETNGKDSYVYYPDYALLKAQNERLLDEIALMNQMFQKHLTPQIRKAIVDAAKDGKDAR